jgi:hypothetical protein
VDGLTVRKLSISSHLTNILNFGPYWQNPRFTLATVELNFTLRHHGVTLKGCKDTGGHDPFRINIKAKPEGTGNNTKCLQQKTPAYICLEYQAIAL